MTYISIITGLPVADIRSDITVEQSKINRAQWKRGDVIPGEYKMVNVLDTSSKPLCGLDSKDCDVLYHGVMFMEFTIKTILVDGRFLCEGIPLEDPDSKFESKNKKNARVFEFGLLVCPCGNKMELTRARVERPLVREKALPTHLKLVINN